MPHELHAEEKQTTIFQCASCGGSALFDPESQQLKCQFCESLTPIERTDEQHIEYPLWETLATYERGERETTRIFHCDNCGAETVLDPYNIADFCSFCGSSHIEEQNVEEVITPSLVVPFQVTHQQAIQKFREWMKKRYFAPSKLMQLHQMDKLTGIYIPYWTFDADTFSKYTVNVGTHYYVTETYTYTDSDGKTQVGTRTVQKTRWHIESGTYTEWFDDILVQATHQTAKALIRKVEPFHLGGLTDYKDEYISGFLAERYAVGLDAGWNIATQAMDSAIRSGIEYQVNGDIVQIMKLKTEYSDETFKHLLLPIWLSSFRFKEKTYQFIINGQTGKVSGQAPVSWVKVLLTTLGIAFVAFLFYMYMEMQ